MGRHSSITYFKKKLEMKIKNLKKKTICRKKNFIFHKNLVCMVFTNLELIEHTTSTQY